ncbi:MAG: pentapeptide repeat-containing protein, partial [Rivularia sp. (in: cyanobacteria)]
SGTRSVNVGKLIDDEYRFNFKTLPSNIHPKFVEWLSKMVEPNIKHRFANATEALKALKLIPAILKPKSNEGNALAQTLALPALLWIAIVGTQGIQKSSISQQHRIARQQSQIYRLLHRQEQLEDKIYRINRLQEVLIEREQANLLNRLQKTKECDNCELEKATLSDAQLKDVSLENANLEHINLVNANLQNSNLSGANLLGARLRGAVLSKANLSNANLVHANLNNADLRGADLRGAKFNFTGLYGTDLRGANLQYTDLDGVNLNHARLKGAIMPDGSVHE